MKRALALWMALAAAAELAACRGTTEVAAERDAGPHSGDCAVCHLPAFNDVKHPLHPGKKPTTCAVCHRNDAWSPTILKHAWPLEGAHAKADCFFCHQGSPPVFEGTSRVCVDCHRPDFDKENAKSPGHAKNGVKCDGCHAPTGWKPARRSPTPEPAITAPPATTPTAGTTTPKPTVAKPTVAKPTVAKPTPTPTLTPKTPATTGPWPDTTSGASRRR